MTRCKDCKLSMGNGGDCTAPCGPIAHDDVDCLSFQDKEERMFVGRFIMDVGSGSDGRLGIFTIRTAIDWEHGEMVIRSAGFKGDKEVQFKVSVPKEEDYAIRVPKV